MGQEAILGTSAEQLVGGVSYLTFMEDHSSKKKLTMALEFDKRRNVKERGKKERKVSTQSEGKLSQKKKRRKINRKGLYTIVRDHSNGKAGNSKHS